MTTTEANQPAPAADTADFEALARQVDEAMAEVQTMPTDMRGKALALKSAIEEFHRVGLTQIVRTLKADPRGKELLFQLVDQPAVYTLFSMHGLVRADMRTQVTRVLEMVRPYLQSHGGDVALVDVQDRTVFVELSGNCTGCSMSQVTLKNTVEETLKEHLPNIEAVKVVQPGTTAGKELPVVQISLAKEAGLPITTANPSAANPSAANRSDGWLEGPAVDDLPSGKPFAFSNSGVEVLVVRSPQGLRAYRNACAHQGLPLDGGMVDEESGTITCPWHGFSFDTESGECFTAPQCQLEPFPLRVSDGKIWVRPE